MSKSCLQHWHFRLRFVPAIFCLFLFVLLVGMGRWQWGRAVEKEQMRSRYEAGLRAAVLHVDEVMRVGVDAQGLPISVHGALLGQHSFLLDNQMQGTRSGFNVLTPLRNERGRWVLVDRGWMPWDQARRIPPIPAPLAGELTLRGRVYFPSDKQILLQADDYSDPEWPLLIQKIDMPAMAGVLKDARGGVELAPFVIRLDEYQDVEQGEELLRHWSWMVMSPEKHRAYAFQWFGMALTLVVLFVVFSVEKSSDE